MFHFFLIGKLFNNLMLSAWQRTPLISVFLLQYCLVAWTLT